MTLGAGMMPAIQRSQDGCATVIRIPQVADRLQPLADPGWPGKRIALLAWVF